MAQTEEFLRNGAIDWNVALNTKSLEINMETTQVMVIHKDISRHM